MFRLLLLLLIALPAGAWFFPQFKDGGDNPCAAMERRFAALVEQEVAKLPGAIAGDKRATQLLTQAQETARSGTGASGRAFAQQKFPGLPPNLACTVGWWQMYLAADMRSALKAVAPR